MVRRINRTFRQPLCLAAVVSASLTATVAHAQGGAPGASAEVRDATGRLVASAEFREGRGEVLVTVTFPNPPVLSGTHAIHVNEVGRCDPPDFATSGGIFNPYNKAHGRQNPEGSEVGDLPNVNFSTGLTAYNTTAIGATLGQGSGSLLSPNRSLLIYSGEDDQKTDPDGNPGVPIACGVIEAPGATPAAAPAVGQASPTPILRTAASPVPAAQPASSPVVPPKPVVVVNNNPPSPTPVAGGAVPTPLTSAPVAATQTQTSSGGLSTLNALIIAVLGAGLIVVGWLLRQRRQQR